MDAQTKYEIIAEITVTAVKTIEQTVRERLKKALPEDFVDKTTDKAVKRIKSSTVPEFKNKVNKIRYEVKNRIVEKIDETISAIEKGKMERCQEKLAGRKKIILKQQKLLRVAEREEGQTILLPIQWMKSSSLEPVGKQLQTKKKREANKQKDKKKQFRNVSPFPSQKKFRNL